MLQPTTSTALVQPTFIRHLMTEVYSMAHLFSRLITSSSVAHCVNIAARLFFGNRSRMWLCLIAAATQTAAGACLAYADELDDAFAQYESLKDNGRHEESLVYAKKALDIANFQVEQGHLDKDDPTLGTLLNNVGMAYQRIGNPQEADSYLLKGLSECERVLGDQDPRTLTRMSNLAANRRMIGDFASSKELHDRAVDLSSKHLDANDPTRSRILSNASIFYLQQRDLDKAEELQTASLEIEKARQASGQPSPRIADRLAKLGEVQNLRGKHADAAETLKAALQILRESPEKNAAEISSIEQSLGVTYYYLGDKQQALVLLDRSFNTARLTAIPTSEVYVNRASTYARLLALNHRLADAMAVIKTIPIAELGTDYSGVKSKLITLQTTAYVWFLDRRFTKAYSVIEEAIQLLNDSPNLSFPSVEPDLHLEAGLTYLMNGDKVKAEAHFTKAIHLQEKTYGENSEQVENVRQIISYARKEAERVLEPEWRRSVRQSLDYMLYLPLAIARDGTSFFLALFCLIMRALTGSWRWFWWLGAYLLIFTALTSLDLSNPNGISVAHGRAVKYVNLVRGSILFVLGPLAHAAIYGVFSLLRFGVRRMSSKMSKEE